MSTTKIIPYKAEMLPKLIAASKAINPTQKQWLTVQLPTMSEQKKRRLFQVLIHEQTERYALNKRRISINSDYLRKKTQLTNGYNEALAGINERNILHELDEDMEQIFADINA